MSWGRRCVKHSVEMAHSVLKKEEDQEEEEEEEEGLFARRIEV